MSRFNLFQQWLEVTK